MNSFSELNWDPPKAARALHIPEAEWELRRTWIRDLYEIGSTLKAIMGVMYHHSAQEGTFFNPTRKQYVLQLRKWNLRRYGANQDLETTSSTTTAKIRQFVRGERDDDRFYQSLHYHQSSCRWCEPLLSMYPTAKHNFEMAFRQGALPEDEMLWKLDLADFYLAAQDLDYAGRLYSEILYRSHGSSDWDLLLIAMKLLQPSFHSSQYRTLKGHLAFLLLQKNDISLEAGNPLWIMYLLRGMICQARGDLRLATQHINGASRLLEEELSDSTSTFGPFRISRRFAHNHSALIAGINSSLEIKNQELNEGLSMPRQSLYGGGAALFPTDSMHALLQWCLKQVESSEYGASLSSIRQKPWTAAPDLISFQRFESTALFCYLWLKYRHAEKAERLETLSLRDSIVLAVEYIENSLQLAAPMIISSVCSMRADEEAADFPTGYNDVTCEQMAVRAIVNLQILTSSYGHYDDSSGADRFYKAYASVSCDNEAANDPTPFRKSMQTFVRQFAMAQFPLSSSDVSTGEVESLRNAYAWDTASFTITDGKADENNAPVRVESTSVAPPAVPKSATLSAGLAINTRPASSSASVNILLTPRSSFASSKTSLRSLRRLGRVAEILLKSKGSEVDQLPSESMSIRSQSSWSLRQLTGVPYLTATSDIAFDEAEEDTVMLS